MSLMGNLPVARVRVIEQRALHAWPALACESLDGWLLRHAAGVTRRANSVWPNERVGEGDLGAQMARVEAFYHDRGLPARYQICPAMQPTNLDDVLAARGYQATARTAVQTTSLDALVAQVDVDMAHQVELLPQPSAAWWACYAEADGVASESVAVRQAICAQIMPATVYASIVREGRTVAVGSAVLEAGWVGFFNIATLPTFRRMGAARALLTSLAAWGVVQGALQGYLQVMAENAAAQQLYRGYGFTTGYFYHYREETLVFCHA